MELRDCQNRDGVNDSLSDETGANRDESSRSNLRRVKRLNPILAAMGNRVRKGRVPSKELRSDAGPSLFLSGRPVPRKDARGVRESSRM